MSIELKIPDVGESIREIQIGRWLKQEGDRVAEDEDLVELETDKASLELPAPSAGVLSKIVKKQGETVAVGEVIGYLLARMDRSLEFARELVARIDAEALAGKRPITVPLWANRMSRLPVYTQSASTAITSVSCRWKPSDAWWLNGDFRSGATKLPTLARRQFAALFTVHRSRAAWS